MTFIPVVLFIAMIGCVPVVAEEALTLPMLDAAIQQRMQAYDVPGVAVGIVKQGKLIYAKGFGVADVGTKAPVTPQTLFKLDSTSKVFTATAVMQLVEQGRIGLDAPAIKHVPYFHMKDPRHAKITVRHLLTHTSGLPGNYKGNYGYEKPDFDPEAIRRHVESLYDKPMAFAPGEKHEYNNNGPVLLSALIQEVTRKPFETYMSEHVLAPLGMTSSSFDFKAIDPSNLAASHVYGKKLANTAVTPYPVTKYFAASDGLFSNIQDLSRFMQVLLNGGSIDGKRVLGEGTLKAMWSRGPNTEDYGLGWGVDRCPIPDVHSVDHTGTSIGSCSALMLFPGKSVGVVVLCNARRDGAERSIAMTLIRYALGMDLNPFTPPAKVILQSKLRDEGLDAALAYYRSLKEAGDTDADGMLMMLAWRVASGREPENLPIAKQLMEVLVQAHPEDPTMNDLLAEFYLRLARIRYQKALEKDPEQWGTRRMLEQLKSVDLDFHQ